MNNLKYSYKIFADDLKVYLGFSKEYFDINVAKCQADIDKLVAESSS